MQFSADKGGIIPPYLCIFRNMIRNSLEEVYKKWQEIQPLNDFDRNRLANRFSIEFNYNSNHIEGNTLTYGQTELLLFFDKVAGEANTKDIDEMKASQVSMKIMATEASEEGKPLTQSFIRQLHRTMLREDYVVHYMMPDGQPSTYTIHAGQYKTRPNSVITRYGDRFDYASPEETPAMMHDLVNWYNEQEVLGEIHPVELAAMFHYRYIRIHPFEDGNGRIARLLANYILSRHNYPMVVVRSRKKNEYLEVLHETDLRVGPSPSDGATASLRKVQRFCTYFKKLVAEEISTNIQFLQEHSKEIWWFDGERITFRSLNTTKILEELRNDPAITYQELQKKIGINMSAIQKQLKMLMDKGYIMHRDNGDWHVSILQSE